MRITLAEYRSTEQMRLMAELKEVATAAWNQEHHPSWYAAGLDSQPLLDHLKALLNQQVCFLCCALLSSSAQQLNSQILYFLPAVVDGT